MPSKTYTEELKRDAVALYENSPEASIHTIATDLKDQPGYPGELGEKAWNRNPCHQPCD